MDLWMRTSLTVALGLADVRNSFITLSVSPQAVRLDIHTLGTGGGRRRGGPICVLGLLMIGGLIGGLID